MFLYEGNADFVGNSGMKMLTHGIGPVRSSERIVEIDILRGFALFGIFVVNMIVFNSDYLPRSEMWADFVNLSHLRFVEIIFENKFFRIYSFLFGLGFAMQLERAKARNAPFLNMYIKRVLGLLVIGLIHALLWEGDILKTYAVLAPFLIPFRKVKYKTFLIWAAVFLTGPSIIKTANDSIRYDQQRDTQTEQLIHEQNKNAESLEKQLHSSYADAFQQGGFSDVLKVNLDILVKERDSVQDFQWCFDSVFVMFLLGMYAGRRKLFHNLRTHKKLLQNVLKWSALVGLTGTVGALLFAESWHFKPLIRFTAPSPLLGNLGSMIDLLGDTGMSLFYISSLMLIITNQKWKERLSFIAPAGRMPLTNYLVQTAVCLPLFYGYALGLFGKVSPLLGFVMVITIYALQLIFSRRWVQAFRFGPAEWMWRSLSYGKIQPIRVRARIII